MTDLIYKDESYAIGGAVFEVYREMGHGFLESVYQECLEKELARRGIPFLSQPVLRLFYKGQPLDQTYKPDLLCYDTVVVELKALGEITGEHKAQILNYLKAARLKLGLLVNFGCHPKATIERLVL
uniref:GxxExxY protein n=1 Tax=Candidatus Kentrum sp. FW TaxID=2126338 RepID=A0A450S9R9_9GAMM|nr:MAG: GxxExxY protein [Candidatus Kentron sp. FW]